MGNEGKIHETRPEQADRDKIQDKIAVRHGNLRPAGARKPPRDAESDEFWAGCQPFSDPGQDRESLSGKRPAPEAHAPVPPRPAGDVIKRGENLAVFSSKKRPRRPRNGGRKGTPERDSFLPPEQTAAGKGRRATPWRPCGDRRRRRSFPRKIPAARDRNGRSTRFWSKWDASGRGAW